MKIRRFFKELGISLLLLAITAGILVGSGLCTRAPETARISPAITNTGLELIVTNNDTFDWMNAQLELNNAFRYEIAAIHAGETLHLKLQDFTKADGTKFDPLSEVPSKLAIACDTPKGKVHWIGSISKSR
jgi:hypothetical protein